MEEIIGLIYETVADPSLWRDVMVLVARWVDAESAWMFHPEREAATVFAAVGVEPSALTAYVDHFHACDVVVEAGMKSLNPHDRLVLRNDEILDDRSFHRSELYVDFARPNRFCRMLAAPLATGASLAGDGRPPILTFFRGDTQPRFDDDMASRFRTVLPHMWRAIRLRRTVDLGGASLVLSGDVAGIVDHLPACLMLLDGRSRLLHANQAARRALDARDGIALRASRVTAWPEGRSSLPGLLARAATGIAGDVMIDRPNGGRWLATVWPLPDDGTSALRQQGGRSWLWLDEGIVRSAGLADRLAGLFSLSPAEAEVAAGLAAGSSPAELAARRGVEMPTIRSQIMALRQKAGLGRTTELAALAARLAATPR